MHLEVPGSLWAVGYLLRESELYKNLRRSQQEFAHVPPGFSKPVEVSEKILKNLLTLLASTGTSAHPSQSRTLLTTGEPKGAWCKQKFYNCYPMHQYQGINLVVCGLVNNATPIPLAI